jgi:hypothetical protein
MVREDLTKCSKDLKEEREQTKPLICLGREHAGRRKSKWKHPRDCTIKKCH